MIFLTYLTGRDKLKITGKGYFGSPGGILADPFPIFPESANPTLGKEERGEKFFSSIY